MQILGGQGVLSYASQTSHMTSEGLGEVFEGLRRKMSVHVNGGMSGGSSMRRSRSEVPHWRERKVLRVKTPFEISKPLER